MVDLEMLEKYYLEQIERAEEMFSSCMSEECNEYWSGVLDDYEAKLSDVRNGVGCDFTG